MLFTRLPLRYKLLIIISLALLSAMIAFLVRSLWFYSGPYATYLSAASSFLTSGALMVTKKVLSKALEPYKALKLDVERFDWHEMADFWERYGAITKAFGMRVPEVEELDGGLKKAEEVECEFLDRTYIPHELVEMVEPHWDDLKVMAKREGIATWYYMKARAISRKDKIVMERVPYLYSYVFHFSPGARVGKKRLREIIRPLVYDNGLVPLERSRLPNHLGVRCVAMTSDGYLIISKRGKELAVGKFLYSLSCEGAVSAPREAKRMTLKDLVHQQVDHELRLAKDEYEAYVMSFSRDMAMMGKPNVYLFLKLKLSMEELKKRLKHVGEDLKFEFVKDYSKVLKNSSHTLVYGLWLFENRVRGKITC